MTIKELAAITQSIGPAIREYVTKSIDSNDRIAALEQKALTPGPKGDPGEKGAAGERGIDGRPGDPGVAGKDAAVDLDALARQAAALIPAPKDGEPGPSGKDADVDIEALAARAAALIPIPKNGDSGAPGPAGDTGAQGPAGKDAEDPDVAVIAALAAELIPAPKDGPAGRDGKDADIEAVSALVLEKCAAVIEKAVSERLEAAVAKALTKAMEALPQPKDGADGGKGEPGPAGRDGIGVAGAILGKDGQLVLTLSDGTVRELGVVIGGKGDPGTNGTNGSDGLGFDNLDASYDEHGRLVLRMVSGERVKLFVVPGFVDQGPFKAGDAYLKGDGVTWDGSLFIAQKDTSAKPETNSDWRLAVKHGRDLRDWRKK